jgi:hypothetical protein
VLMERQRTQLLHPTTQFPDAHEFFLLPGTLRLEARSARHPAHQLKLSLLKANRAMAEPWRPSAVALK